MCSVLSKSPKLCGESSSPHLLQVWALTCTVGLQVQGDVTYSRMGFRCGQARLWACIPMQKLPVSAFYCDVADSRLLQSSNAHRNSTGTNTGCVCGLKPSTDAAVNGGSNNCLLQIRDLFAALLPTAAPPKACPNKCTWSGQSLACCLRPQVGTGTPAPSSRLSHLFPLPCCKQIFQVSKACPATNRPGSMLLLSETHAGAAAVHGGASAAPPKSGDVYTEADWNETSTLENKEGYWVSKASGGQLAHGDVRPADCGGCCVSGANKLQPTMGTMEQE